MIGQFDKMPLVTIGIPTYNNATYIADAVNSVIAQDYPNLEIIIIDDASDDNTSEVVAAFKTDARVRYYRNEHNIGRVATYHKGLFELANGEWYLNLDGDDYLTDPAFISKAVSWIGQYKNVVMVAGACERRVNGKLDYTVQSKYTDECSMVEGKTYFLDLPSQRAYFSHLTTLYNRKRALELNFYEEDILSADFESIYQLILTGNIISYNRVVGVWRIHGSNVSSNSFFSVDEVIKNFKFVEKPASFATAYFKAATVRQWRKRYIIKIIESYILKVIISRPKNSLSILARLFIKYPYYFTAACFRILILNLKKIFFRKKNTGVIS